MFFNGWQESEEEEGAGNPFHGFALPSSAYDEPRSLQSIERCQPLSTPSLFYAVMIRLEELRHARIYSAASR